MSRADKKLIRRALAGHRSAPAAAASTSPVPRLVRFSGVAADSDGKPASGTIGITFAVYSQQSSGPALWMETQNVAVDATGHYSVMLGATQPEGLPVDLFDSGDGIGSASKSPASLSSRASFSSASPTR